MLKGIFNFGRGVGTAEGASPISGEALALPAPQGALTLKSTPPTTPCSADALFSNGGTAERARWLFAGGSADPVALPWGNLAVLPAIESAMGARESGEGEENPLLHLCHLANVGRAGLAAAASTGVAKLKKNFKTPPHSFNKK